MIGYILMALGAYLVADDIIKARRAKNAKLLENGNGGRGSNRNSKPRANGKKPDRYGRVKPIGIPVEKQGGKDELHKKPIPPDKPDSSGGRPGDHSNSQQDTTSNGGKAESVKAKTVRTKDKGGNDGTEINSENGAGNDGYNVVIEPDSVNESDRTQTD